MFSFINPQGFSRDASGRRSGLLPLRASGQSSPSIPATRPGGKIALIAGTGTNVLLVKGPDGLLMIDGGVPEHFGFVEDVGGAPEGRPVRALFNAHWHLEN